MAPSLGNIPAGELQATPGGRVFRGLAAVLAFALVPSLARGQVETPASAVPSFRNEVMAVFAKAGCSAGTCHGNKNGKGGFKLSLRGQDPAADYLTLTRDLFARRLNVLDADESLILLKPTGQVAHEGGLRFEKGSVEYSILGRWLAAGMPSDLEDGPQLARIEVTPSNAVLLEPQREIPLRVQAVFSNSSVRDVTGLAVYEPANGRARVSHDGLVERLADGETTVLVRYLQCQEPVRIAFVPERPGFQWSPAPLNNYIDFHIFSKLRTLRLNPAGLCSDDVFLRRAYLDLLGILPTAEEARAFLQDEPIPGRAGRAGGRGKEARPRLEDGGRQVEKRARLVDRLLQRPEFADFWALKWADLLRVEAHSLDAKGVQDFHHWIRQRVAANVPLDRFVRELITGRGSTYDSPAANYYRPNRDPLARARSAAQVFLGTRLQCAECHNHPSDRWTQDDYYDWAGLFARVRYKVIENKREISSDEHEWNGEQVVFLARDGAVQNPRTGRPAHPRFLGDSAPAPGDGRDGAGPADSAEPCDPLEALAAWITSPTNALFARVQANRIWSHLMGRGLVDPPDDFRATNPASHPELLEALARDLVEHRFDMRHLIRIIMNSRVYQLDSSPAETGADAEDDALFAHALVRRLGAEQLLDCQSQVTGVPLKFAGHPPGLRAAQLPGVRPESKGRRRSNPTDQFLEIFGKPPRLLTTDTERSCECNMGQAFQMISGLTVNELLSEKDNRVSGLLSAGRSDREILEELFWTALTRPPAPGEARELLADLGKAADRRAALEDILWGLVNSKEFCFRR